MVVFWEAELIVLFRSGYVGAVGVFGLVTGSIVAALCVRFVELLYHVDQSGIDALTYTCQTIQFLWPSFLGQAPQLKGLLEDHR